MVRKRRRPPPQAHEATAIRQRWIPQIQGGRGPVGPKAAEAPDLKQQGPRWSKTVEDPGPKRRRFQRCEGRGGTFPKARDPGGPKAAEPTHLKRRGPKWCKSVKSPAQSSKGPSGPKAEEAPVV